MGKVPLAAYIDENDVMKYVETMATDNPVCCTHSRIIWQSLWHPAQAVALVPAMRYERPDRAESKLQPYGCVELRDKVQVPITASLVPATTDRALVRAYL